MAASAFTLDGVEFKLSEDFKPKPMITIPCTIRKKDINDLLKKYNYDFGFEKKVVLMDETKKKEIKKQRKKEVENKKLKMEKRLDSKAEVKKEKPKLQNGTPNFSLGILTPEKYTNAKKRDSPQHENLDVNDFVEENLDPFSNAELQTIDDFKELQDVLQNVTMGGLSSTTTSAIAPAHTATSDITQSSSRVPNHNHHNDNASLSVSDIKVDVNSVHSSPELFRKADPSSSAMLPETNIFLSPPTASTSASVPSISTNPFGSEFNQLPCAENLARATTPTDQLSDSADNDTLSQNVTPFFNTAAALTTQAIDAPKQNDVSERNDLDVYDLRKPKLFPKPTKNNTSEHNYVNVSDFKNPQTAPQPLPRSKLSKLKDESSNSTKSKLKLVPPSDSRHAVQNKVLANKSKEERSKFEETINKALTSLPTLPQSVVLPKAFASSKVGGQNNVTGELQKSKSKSTILEALSSAEKEFALSIVAMGFKEDDVVRAMEIYGTDHKEVLDYLIKVQCLSEKSFSVENIEEALELFHGDVEEAAKYLTLQQQFLDMGFPKAKIKEALLLHNTDQTKALEELMSSL